MLHHPNNINQLVVQNKYTGQAAPFAPLPLQQYQRYYETVRPLHRHRYSNLTGLPFLVAPLASYGEFPCSHDTASIQVMPPLRRMSFRQ